MRRLHLLPVSPVCTRAAGRGLSGDVAFHDLAVDATRFADIPSIAKLQYGFRVPSRAADAHKNACGYVHIVGGNQDMPGALALAADMVMRSGAGKCTLQGHSANYSSVLAGNPECMWWSGQSVPPSDVVLIGPGLGRDEWAQSQLDTLSGFKGQIVADADALFFMANNNDMPFGVDVVTPHIGEAARLLQVDSDVIVRTRLNAAQAIAQQFDAVCVLKGPGTVIAAPDGHLTIIDAGHPGMATAGSGDVLAGLIASFIAQGYHPEQAAIQASAMHAMAGEHAARRFGNGLIARNIVESAQCLMCC